MLGAQFKQPRMTSSQAHFSKVPKADIPRSVFDRSHTYKTTFDAGFLVPIYVDEVLPGDSFKMRMTSFARLATPVVPVMDNLYADVFFFFVPNRLIWANWEKFNGAQDNPGDSTSYTVPQVTSAAPGFGLNSLFDYMGIPPEVNYSTASINALHSRAYNLIYNEWFRDQNMQNSVVVDTDDGPDASTDYVLLRRGKRHDYFTSALPWPQKGTAITLPLGSIAQVAPYDPAAAAGSEWTASTKGLEWGWVETASLANYGRVDLNSEGSPQPLQATYESGNPLSAGMTTVLPWLDRWGDSTSHTYLAADLSGATASTINALRESFQLQRMLERDARGGTRYVEIIKSHFGVVSPDYRLQRPEYLGGGSAMVNVSPIPQTSETNVSVTPQGNLAAMGTFSHQGIGFNSSFTEHGVVLGLLGVRADLTYQQGYNRMWSRQTRYDFYWPTLAHLGEQSILMKEIYSDASATDETVFGYQERYAEYRYKPSLITGLFRSGVTGTLDTWHLAQEFVAAPALNNGFIQEDPPIDRVIAVSTEPHFLLDVVFNLKCARPMPVYSVPGLIDHF